MKLFVIKAVFTAGSFAVAFWAWTIWSVYFSGGQTVIKGPQPDSLVETTAIGDGFFVLEGAGGIITASVGSDGILIVDSGYEQMAPNVLSALAKLGDAPVVRIINTHFHGDHSGGNIELSESGADIVFHTHTVKN